MILTPRDLNGLYDIARIRHLSSDQMHRLHFSEASMKTCLNRMGQLADKKAMVDSQLKLI